MVSKTTTMEAAKVLQATPPDMMPGSDEQALPRLTTIPSPDEKGFFYPALDETIPTQVIRGVGKVAGTSSKVEYTMEGPADKSILIDDIPLLVFHGLCGVQSAYDDFRSQVAQRGKWAVTWKPVRSKGPVGDLNPWHYLHSEKLASQAALGVVRDIHDKTGHELFDEWAHSNGGPPAVELALYKRELVRFITLAGVVGIDEHNIIQMAGRLAKFAKNDLLPSLPKLATSPRFLLEEAEYVGRNFTRTIAETVSAGSCSLHERIQRVRDLGIPVAGIQYALDDFHPLDAVTEAVTGGSGDLLDVYHVYRDPKARHTAPQTDPSGSAEAHFEVSRQLQEKSTLSVAV